MVVVTLASNLAQQEWISRSKKLVLNLLHLHKSQSSCFRVRFEVVAMNAVLP